MILARVRDQQRADLRKIQPVAARMPIGIGAEIDQQIVVYQRLRAGSEILSASAPCSKVSPLESSAGAVLQR